MGKNRLIALPSGMTGCLVGQHMEQGEADGCTARILAPGLLSLPEFSFGDWF